MVCSVQRFGSSLNLNCHLHVIAPDRVLVGVPLSPLLRATVFVRDGDGVRFVPVTVDHAMVLRVVQRARKSMLRWLAKKGHLKGVDGLLKPRDFGREAGEGRG